LKQQYIATCGLLSCILQHCRGITAAMNFLDFVIIVSMFCIGSLQTILELSVNASNEQEYLIDNVYCDPLLDMKGHERIVVRFIGQLKLALRLAAFSITCFRKHCADGHILRCNGTFSRVGTLEFHKAIG